MPRVKRRYLAIKIEIENVPHKRDVIQTIWHNLLELFGEYGASQVGLALIDYNMDRNHLILRCSHKAVNLLRIAVMSITEINRDRAYLRVVSISGTIKALKNKIEEYEKKAQRLQ